MGRDRMPNGCSVLRRCAALVRDVVVALLAGGVSVWIAVAGDGDGIQVTGWHRLASGYLPYVVIVCALGATAPSALSAAIRTSGSQLLMVWGYYTWGPMITFEKTPTQAAHYAEKWTLVALTAVPLAGLAAYAARRLARWCATTVRTAAPSLREPARKDQDWAHHHAPATARPLLDSGHPPAGHRREAATPHGGAPTTTVTD